MRTTMAILSIDKYFFPNPQFEENDIGAFERAKFSAIEELRRQIYEIQAITPERFFKERLEKEINLP
jgi:hypothetical protein